VAEENRYFSTLRIRTLTFMGPSCKSALVWNKAVQRQNREPASGTLSPDIEKRAPCLSNPPAVSASIQPFSFPR
jgi:hypothetical protein